MKRLQYGILGIAALGLLGLTGCKKGNPENSPVEGCWGTYVGFAPTDESPTATGELEMTIDESGVEYKMATGLGIEKVHVPAAKITPKSLQGIFREGSVYLQRSKGSDVDGRLYICTPDAKEHEYALIVLDGTEEVLGPTALFSEEQVERGDYKRFVERVESHFGKNSYPTLENNGRVSR